MTRLILHLGDHKTGTSTLQRLFAANHGPDHVLYPTAGRANGAGHHNLAWEVGSDPRFNPAKGGWAEAWREIGVRSPKIALISTEAFEFKRPNRVMTAVCKDRPPSVSRIDGIVYLRPHASRLLSSFAERVKRGIGPFDRSVFLDQALSSPRYQFAPRIKRWRKALILGQLDVRVFLRPQMAGGDIVQDFFTEVLAIPPPTTIPASANETPNALSLRMMQMQGAAFCAAGGPRFARANASAIRAAALLFGDGPKPVWSRPEAERIRQACTADATALDTMLGGTHFITALNDIASDTDVEANLDEPTIAAMTETASAVAQARSMPTLP